MLDAYLYLGKRSPFGRYGGALSGVRPDDLLGDVIKSVVDEGPFNAEDIDDVIVGCGNQGGEDARWCRAPRIAFCRPSGIRSWSGPATQLRQRSFRCRLGSTRGHGRRG